MFAGPCVGKCSNRCPSYPRAATHAVPDRASLSTRRASIWRFHQLRYTQIHVAANCHYRQLKPLFSGHIRLVWTRFLLRSRHSLTTWGFVGNSEGTYWRNFFSSTYIAWTTVEQMEDSSIPPAPFNSCLIVNVTSTVRLFTDFVPLRSLTISRGEQLTTVTSIWRQRDPSLCWHNSQCHWLVSLKVKQRDHVMLSSFCTLSRKCHTDSTSYKLDSCCH